MPTRRNYLYGVIPADGAKTYGPIGIAGTDVRAVADGPIAMVAGPIGRVEFSHLAPEKALRHLAEHQRVLEQVMVDSPVIPLKFGTVAEDDQQIVGILRSGQGEFAGALREYAGKVEVDLAAFWTDVQAVLAEIAAEEAVVSLKAQIAASGPATMAQRVQLGRLVKELLDQRRGRIRAELLVSLRTKYPDILVNPPQDDAEVLNAAFLVHRGHEARFDETIDHLGRQYENRLRFRRVGPLPPYSFATAEVRSVAASQLDAARKVLELAESASLADIKAAYRRLLHKHHPDKSPDPAAAERVKQISAAYELLEQYALNFKHRFCGADNGRLAIVRIRSVSALRGDATARAA